MRTIYTKIQRLAAERNLSIAEVERRCGFKRLNRWGNVLPSIDKVCKVAQVLGVTVDEIVKDVDFGTSR